MIVRLLHCRTCGHRLRYGASRCGACGQPTQTLNRYWVIFPVLVVLFVGVLSFM